MFEQEIHDFPGFCEERQDFDREFAQNLRIFHIATPHHSPDVLHVQ
jgi:hypothetical protein